MKYFNNQILLGKKILITGASSGIGAETAKHFAEYGAELILLGRNEDKLNEVKSYLNNSNSHLIVKTDLALDDEAFRVITNLPKNFLPLNGIFHSAGKELVKPILLTKSADFKDLVSTTVQAALSISRALAKKNIMNDNSSVVFMSSVSAISGTPGLTAYSASKSALIGLTKSLALEFAHRKIRFNCLLSGAVISPMHERLLNNLSIKSVQDYESKHPLGFGEKSDISNITTFLMSEASKWITGTSISVDGGYCAK